MNKMFITIIKHVAVNQEYIKTKKRGVNKMLKSCSLLDRNSESPEGHFIRYDL
jgi:hypothetical protein